MQTFFPGWNVQYDVQRPFNYNPWMYFDRFVLRFFKYYEHFDYDQFVIFPHFGVPVPKLSYASDWNGWYAARKK